MKQFIHDWFGRYMWGAWLHLGMNLLSFILVAYFIYYIVNLLKQAASC